MESFSGALHEPDEQLLATMTVLGSQVGQFVARRRAEEEVRAREPFDVLDAGRVAAISDPTGAIVSLWQPRSRVGATLVNDVGALCWKRACDDRRRAG